MGMPRKSLVYPGEYELPQMCIRDRITDNYDSSKKDADLMVAVTNIANDLYAKDISKKISASKQEALSLIHILLEGL